MALNRLLIRGTHIVAIHLGTWNSLTAILIMMS